jgi:glyoxylase-like metal-dependent hydrolase (beta-lactamase superfamily II)
MQILQNTGGIAATNCYVVGDEDAKVAVLFDAPNDTVGPLLDEVQRRGWDLIGLWLTHGHFDHLADHAVVRTRFPNAKLLMHRLDEPMLITPKSRLFPLPFEIPSGKADGYIEGGQQLWIGSLELVALHTPGHAPGHLMFHFPKEQVLIGGDLIIMGAVGRTDFPGCNAAALDESIRRVMKLPPQTTLLPGHGDPSTLADEMETNSYVITAVGESPR